MKKRAAIAVAIGALAAMLLAIPALGAPSRDANNDRIPDRWEKRNDLSLNVNQAKRDQDQDGLKNLGEYRNGTDPREADSDADGTEDGTECAGHEDGHRPPPPSEDPTEPLPS
jgi:hypothetical protein